MANIFWARSPSSLSHIFSVSNFRSTHDHEPLKYTGVHIIVVLESCMSTLSSFTLCGFYGCGMIFAMTICSWVVCNSHLSKYEMNEGKWVLFSVFLNRTPILDWCMVGWGSKNKHHERHIFIRYWTKFSNFVTHSKLNSEHNWEDLCIQLRNQQAYTSGDHN